MVQVFLFTVYYLYINTHLFAANCAVCGGLRCSFLQSIYKNTGLQCIEQCIDSERWKVKLPVSGELCGFVFAVY